MNKNNINLNDKDIITNLLTLLKDIEKNMTVSLTEASNEKLYKEYKDMFDTIALYQRQCYELMYQKGWYKLENVPSSKINTIINQLNTDLDDLEKI